MGYVPVQYTAFVMLRSFPARLRRRSREAWRAVVLMALGAGCGTARPHHPTVASSARPSSSPPPSSSAPAEVASEAILAPVLEDPWVPRRETDGTLRVVLGSLRADLLRDAVQIGRGRFAAAIGQATEVPNGWVFVANDGTVARSREYTGALERLGSIPRALGPVRYTHGRMALVDDAGTVWTTDGTAPVAAVTSLPEERALAVVFRSANDGAVVLAGGALFVTHDGGTTWRSLDLAGAGAFDVFTRGEVIVVSSTDGDRALGPGDTLIDPPARVIEHPSLDDDQRTRLLRAARNRYPVLLDSADHAVRRPDGTALLARGRDVLVLDAHDGHEISIHADALATGCHLEPWGPNVAALCPYRDPPLYRSTDGEHYQPVVGQVSYSLVFSDDGRHAARSDVCPGDSEEHAGPSAFCALRQDGQWVTRDAGGEVSQVVAMRGAEALVMLTPASPHSPELMVVDVESGERTPVRVVEDDALEGLRIERAGWTTDGVVHATASVGRSTGAPHVLLIGTATHPLAVRALPSGALFVTFADARHGVAAGNDLSKVWMTRDGGEHWSAVTIPVDGAADAVPIRSSVVRRGVECDAHRCVVNERIRIEGFGPAHGTPADVLAAQHATPARLESTGGVTMPSIRCDVDRTHHPAGSASPAGAGDLLATAGVRARVHATRDEAAHWGAEVRWAGVDARGAFHGASRVRALDLSPGDANDDLPRYILRGGTRSGVLFERCTGDFGTACVLLWGSVGGSIQRIAARDQLPRAVDARVFVTDAMALDDGGMMVLMQAAPEGASVELVLVIAPDGTIRTRRGFAWEPHDQLRALGRFRGAAGYVVGDVTDPYALRFYPLTQDVSAQPVHFARLANGNIGACTGPRPPESGEIVSTQGGYLPDVTVAFAGGLSDLRAAIEVGPAGTCVRSIDSWVGVRALFDRTRWNGTGLELRTGDQGFVGVSGASTAPVAVHCEAD